MMDSVVKTQGGRKRKDRIKRMNMRKWEEQQQRQTTAAGEGSSNSNTASSPSKLIADQATKKRDASGHFIKEKVSPPDQPIPDYLMPLYQVRRAPTYTTRTGHFHDYSRLALAREIKEMGLGVAVGPMGYVCSMGSTSSSVTTTTPTFYEDLTVGNNPSLINPASANSVFLTSSRLPYILPDGTHVEISTLSRCDIVELYFANDDYNSNYLDDKFDEAVRILDRYNEDIEEYLTKQEDDKNEVQGGEKGIGVTLQEGKLSSEAGDAYSNTSYLGLGKSRPVGKRRKYYPPETVSRKLYSACLPYIRTTPPNINNNGEGGDGGGGSGGLATLNPSMDDNYFHYLTSAPPAQMVCDSAFRCDRDQQASLLGNVILCGGGACITGAAGVGSAGQSGGGAVVPGTDGAVAGVMASMLGDEHAFPDRLREEIEAIVHRHTPGWRVKVTSPNVSERAICSWLGGSILGSLGTFQDMWISRKDYEEFGAAIVNRKCP
jgi:hypothetical protein